MMNTNEVSKLAQEAIGNARVGVAADDLQTVSPWVAQALASTGAICDAQTVARKMSIARKSWLGIPVQQAQANQTGLAVPGDQGINVQQMFIGTSLRVSASATADNFNITQLYVGVDTQLVGGPVPATVFSEVSLAAQIDMDVSMTGKYIKLIVDNITAGTPYFRGAFAGYTVKGC